MEQALHWCLFNLLGQKVNAASSRLYLMKLTDLGSILQYVLKFKLLLQNRHLRYESDDKFDWQWRNCEGLWTNLQKMFNFLSAFALMTPVQMDWTLRPTICPIQAYYARVQGTSSFPLNSGATKSLSIGGLVYGNRVV